MYYINKIKHVCVRCVPSCLPLLGNGKHSEALPILYFNVFVYHVYLFHRARIRAIFSQLIISLKGNFYFNNFFENFSCAREYYLNGTQGTQVNISLIVKGFPVFTFIIYSTHNGTHHTHIYNEGF